MNTVLAHSFAPNGATPNNIFTAHYRRTTRDLHITFEAIKVGCVPISDTALRLYKALSNYDKPNRRGYRKGYVFVATRTLARLLKKSVRTIERWIKELESVGLITRKQRPNTSSILYFHDVTEEALCAFIDTQRSYPQVSREEMHNVVCHHQKSDSKMSFAYSGNEVLRNNSNTKREQFSEAEDNVVRKLEKLGFDSYLARQFVRRYGAERVDRQITNLCLELKHGILIRHYARWLYRAIEYHGGEGYTCSTLIPTQPSLCAPAKGRQIEVVEIDEDAQIVYVVERETQSGKVGYE
jgi:DNA-binding MarR family transcriptional regulator